VDTGQRTTKTRTESIDTLTIIDRGEQHHDLA
ncbi:MAG: hypothetical protein ACI87H_002516, partial [Gammaproteobacteria bacterium]